MPRGADEAPRYARDEVERAGGDTCSITGSESDDDDAGHALLCSALLDGRFRRAPGAELGIDPDVCAGEVSDGEQAR